MTEAELLAEGQRVVDEMLEIQQTRNKLFVVFCEDHEQPGKLLQFLVRAPGKEEALLRVEQHTLNAAKTFYDFRVVRLSQSYRGGGVYYMGLY